MKISPADYATELAKRFAARLGRSAAIAHAPIGGRFMATETSNLAAVKAALADIGATIADAEKELRGLSLAAALSPGSDAENIADAAQSRLDALTARRRLLQEALLSAEEAEAARVDQK